MIYFQSEVEEIPFTSPQEFQDQIEELEDRNLSLIGYFQQSEEEFDEIERIYIITASKLDVQIDQLKSQMEIMHSTAERDIIRAEG